MNPDCHDSLPPESPPAFNDVDQPMPPTAGWFKAVRSHEALELIAMNPYAFILLYIIAYRANWHGRFNRHGLKQGEALIGDHKNMGMSRQNYRTARQLLEKHGFSTFRSTTKGTVATLCNSTIFDINELGANQQNNQRPTNSQPTGNHQPTISQPSTNQRVTNGQPSANHQPTTNKEVKEIKEGKEVKEVKECKEVKEGKERSMGNADCGALELFPIPPAPPAQPAKPKPKPGPKQPDMADDAEWIATLQRDPAYNHVNVANELNKLIHWCTINHKAPTKRRFLNWLNRCEKPLSPVDAAKASVSTSYDDVMEQYKAIIGG